MLAAKDEELVSTLSFAALPSSAEVVGEHLRKAADLVDTLRNFNPNWQLLEATSRLTDERARDAALIHESVVEAFESDELVIPLAPRLAEAHSQAVRLLTEQPKPTPAPTAPPLPTTATVATAWAKDRVITRDTREGLTAGDLERLLAEMRHALEAKEEARLRLSWEIYVKKS